MAALYVVLGHTIDSEMIVLNLGQEAVIVFFLLSGFVIEYSHHCSRDKSFGSYFTKRFVRIYSVLIPMLVLSAIIIQPDAGNPEFWKTLCGNLLMLQDFESGKPHVIVPTLFASALWSLHYEWWFYMLYYPVATHVGRERQGAMVVVLAIVAAVFYTRFPYALPRLVMYFMIWWAGVELARSYLKHGRVQLKDLYLPFLGLLAISAALMVPVARSYLESRRLQFGVHPMLEFRHFAAAILTMVIALVWQAVRWRGFAVLRPGVFIAPISYSLYIAHQPLLSYADYLRFLNRTVLEHAIYLVVLLLFCYLTELRFYRSLKRSMKGFQN